MKLYYCILFTLTYTVQTLAQCDIHTKTDDFSGKTVMWTDKVKVAHDGVAAVIKSRRDDNCTYRTYLTFLGRDGKLFITISEDADMCWCTATSVSFKLATGAILIKSNAQKGQSAKTRLGQEQYVVFEITKAELAQLAAATIAKLKISEPGCQDHNVIEEELESKAAQSIMKNAQCFLSKVQ